MTFRARCVFGTLLRRLGASGDWLCYIPSEPGAEPHHLDEVLVGELAGFPDDPRVPLFSILQFFRDFFPRVRLLLLLLPQVGDRLEQARLAGILGDELPRVFHTARG